MNNRVVVLGSWLTYELLMGTVHASHTLDTHLNLDR